MPRYNSSPNPSCANNATGWLGGVARITSLTGTPRSTGGRVTMGSGSFSSFIESPFVTASSGQTWTAVCWVRTSVSRTVRVDITRHNSGSFVGDSNYSDVSLSANTWTQVRIVATLPSATFNQAAVTIDLPTSGSTGNLDMSSVRMELVNDSSMVYEDGDSGAPWQWDGTAGSSTSTRLDTTLVSLTDSGTGTDSIDIQVTLDLSDSGVGTDLAPTVFDTTANAVLVNIWDAGVGSDTLDQYGPALSDSGVGTDEIFIRKIPFTQVLPAFRAGNVYHLVVVARVPQPSGPPLLVEIDPIEWSSLTWTDTRSAPQELSASCLVSGLTDSVVDRLRDLANQPTELWLYRNGEIVAAGPIVTGNVTGESLEINARGLLSYLRLMYVTSDLTFKQVDQLTVARSLVNHWQNLTYGNYGINTTATNISGVLRDATYLRNELHNIGQRVEDLGKAANGFDIEVDPDSRQLLLWYPRKGIDRSQGEDAVVFDARNITSSSVAFSVAPGDVASDAFGTATNSNADTTYSTASNDELRARYGRAGVTGSWDQVDQNTLNSYLQELLTVRAEMLIVPGPDARDTPDADLTKYNVGDIVMYQPNERLMASRAYRIRRRTVKVSSNGQESVSLEFT